MSKNSKSNNLKHFPEIAKHAAKCALAGCAPAGKVCASWQSARWLSQPYCCDIAASTALASTWRSELTPSVGSPPRVAAAQLVMAPISSRN